MKPFSCIVCIVFIAFIVCIPSVARPQVSENFSDGDFTQNPVWTGDTVHFEVNSAGQLHLLSAGSDTSFLTTGSSFFQEAEWIFWMKLSFNTSANNHARVYLAADSADLSLTGNGYYLQAGGSDDSLSVVKLEAGAAHLLYRFGSYRTNHSANTFRIRITRTGAGWWNAWIDTTGGNSWLHDGTFFDNSFLPPRWFGVWCRYTSSNAAKCYFDDFYAGPRIVDTVAPRVLSAEAETALRLRVVFTEPVGEGAEEPENYRLVGLQTYPDSIRADPGPTTAYRLFLSDPLPDGIQKWLEIRNIRDPAGNLLKDTALPVVYHPPRAFDVLIHEFLADPDPQIQLPPGEFAELYNRSGFPVNLNGWTFSLGSYVKTFPLLMLPPEEYLVIAKDSAYCTFGRCALLFSGAYSLPNEGSTLTLRDAVGHIIHSVSYDISWFGGSYKENGGWSLEMIDPANPCGCAGNWAPSENPAGGTPGKPNSVHGTRPDESLPYLLSAWISGPAEVVATFSEAMDSVSTAAPVSWLIHSPGGAFHPSEVIPLAPDFGCVKLRVETSFLPSVNYTLQAAGGITDCAGLSCDSSRTVRFAVPVPVAAGDLVINELLPDPAPGGSRFLEIYNRSQKVVDLQTVVMAGKESEGGFPADPVQLVSGGRLLFPGEYAVVTPDPDDIARRYFRAVTSTLLKMSDFPTLDGDSGTVFLARYDNLVILDRLRYRATMHYPLLTTTEGVSLERTDPDLATEAESNWHSAAETAGFATPGGLNSHHIACSASDQEVDLEPVIFSPDNDGNDDLLKITLREREPDRAVTVVVYDALGRQVCVVANHVLTGGESVFFWDGITEQGTRAPLGRYVVYVELARPGAALRKIRKTAVVAGR